MAEPSQQELQELRTALHTAARSFKQIERRCRREARECMQVLNYLRAFFARYGIDVQVSARRDEDLER